MSVPLRSPHPNQLVPLTEDTVREGLFGVDDVDRTEQFSRLFWQNRRYRLSAFV